MHFRVFCRLLLLVVSASALASYFVSHSIRKVIVAMVASSLLLQVAYFGSVLFLVWQSTCAQRRAQRAHLGGRQDVRHHSQEYHEGDR